MRRRRFLKIGLWGSGALLAAGAGLSLWPSRTRFAPTGELRVLDAARFNVLAHVAARVVDLPDADPVAIAHGVDEAIARGSDEAQGDFRTLLRLLENGLAGLLLDGRPMNFTRLDEGGQRAALEAMRDSGLTVRRAGYHALRKLCLAAHYARESTWAALGYPGPPQISLPG